ncbi:MAG: class I SAM-dependent methyltransferase [Sandaracinaceae bacterium]|nr:class I SAM-dependent methyltransferase [Sandaracinaceae bacterium]
MQRPRTGDTEQAHDGAHERAREKDELGLEFFADYFAYAPAALALRECVRLAAMRGVELPEPILDVGCGDGVFARLCYPERQVWGIDVNPSEIRRAQSTATYSTLICGSITTSDLPQGYFKSAIANCSLEHVPDIAGAFRTISGALAKDAPFVLIVPTPDWTHELLIPRILEVAGLSGLARFYRDGLDRIFYHVHLYDEARWRELLEEAGFAVDHVEPIVSSGVAGAFDVLLYPSVSGWITKRLTGRWTLMPPLRRALSGLPKQVVRGLAAALGRTPTKPGEYVIHARKL